MFTLIKNTIWKAFTAFVFVCSISSAALAQGEWREFANEANKDEQMKSYIAGMALGAVLLEASVQAGTHEFITFCPPKDVNINDGIAIEALRNSPLPKDEVTAVSITLAVVLGLQKMFPCK